MNLSWGQVAAAAAGAAHRVKKSFSTDGRVGKSEIKSLASSFKTKNNKQATRNGKRRVHVISLATREIRSTVNIDCANF